MADAAKYHLAELCALYHERWELELGYDEVKTEMLDRQESIRSKTPQAVAQELFGILLAYNLVRLEAQSIADDIGVPPVQISFVGVLRYVTRQWLWAGITATLAVSPPHGRHARQDSRFVLPPRRPKRGYPAR